MVFESSPDYQQTLVTDILHESAKLDVTYTGPSVDGCTVPVGRVVLLDLRTTQAPRSGDDFPIPDPGDDKLPV